MLVTQWSGVVRRISEADELVVLGYGFPPEDLYAQHIFRSAALRRAGSPKLKISLYETEERVAEVTKQVARLFGGTDFDLCWNGPVGVLPSSSQSRVQASPFEKYRGSLKHLVGQDPDSLVEEMRGQ